MNFRKYGFMSDLHCIINRKYYACYRFFFDSQFSVSENRQSHPWAGQVDDGENGIIASSRRFETSNDVKQSHVSGFFK